MSKYSADDEKDLRQQEDNERRRRTGVKFVIHAEDQDGLWFEIDVLDEKGGRKLVNCLFEHALLQTVSLHPVLTDGTGRLAKSNLLKL